MRPRLSPLCVKFSAVIAASALAAPVLSAAPAQTTDNTPPVNAAQMLQALQVLRDQQAATVKASKQQIIAQVTAAASSPEKAVALWFEAVRMTEFEGAGHESTQFMAWKNGEGEAFKDHEIQNALRLYFTWLSYTLQRSNGAKVKDLLPTVISYTKDLQGDLLAIEAVEDAQKREKEMNAGKAPARGAKGGGKAGSEVNIKKVHDSILKRPLDGSLYVQWMKIGDWTQVEKWEQTPGSFDGIYRNIILPQMRLEKDPRLLEYWDMKMKMAADEAARTRLAFDADKFNSLTMPTLLWGKYNDEIVLGQRNRALTEMFTLIKKYPTHPDTKDWSSTLEQLLTTPPASAAVPAPAPAPAAAATVPAPAPAPADAATPPTAAVTPADGTQPPR